MTELMPPASFAGKIQRGLGSGFLGALERPCSDVESIVLDCIAHDPRINEQDEDRGLYYARLMLALEIEESRSGRSSVATRMRTARRRATGTHFPLDYNGSFPSGPWSR